MACSDNVGNRDDRCMSTVLPGGMRDNIHTGDSIEGVKRREPLNIGQVLGRPYIFRKTSIDSTFRECEDYTDLTDSCTYEEEQLSCVELEKMVVITHLGV